MRAGILQPGYLPWLGFFEQLDQTDCFVLLDDVQYDKNGWRNRNRIKTAQGPLWLTIPVHVPSGTLIKDVRIDNQTKWQRAHLESIVQNYSRTQYFSEFREIFSEVYSKRWEFLADLDEHLIRQLSSILGLKQKRIIRSSELLEGKGHVLDRTDRLLEICSRLGAQEFYEGASGKQYLDVDTFERKGVRVRFQDYRHPSYPQLYGDFIPYLSVVDLIFNQGAKSLEVIRKGVGEAL